MFDTMYEANGVGLAAPQVGILKRIFVVDCGDEEGNSVPYVFINHELLIEKVFRQDTKDVLAYRASQVWFQEHRK